MPKKLIGHVEATVKFPLYEGDNIDSLEQHGAKNFEYRDPGVTDDGQLGVCVRECETLESKVVRVGDVEGGG